jgi:hypothetical protein
MTVASLLEIFDYNVDDTSEAGHVDRNGIQFGSPLQLRIVEAGTCRKDDQVDILHLMDKLPQ